METAGSQRFGHRSGRAGKHPQQAGQRKQAPGHDQRKGNGVIRRQPRGKAHKQSGGQPPQRRLQQKIPAAQVLQAEAAVPQPRDAVQQPVHQPGQGGSPHRKALGKGDMLGAGQAAHRRGKNVRQQHLQDHHHQRGRQAVPHHAGQLLDQRPDKGRLPQAPQVQVQHPGGPAQQQQQVKDDRGRQYIIQDIGGKGDARGGIPVQVGGPGGKGIGLRHGVHQRHQLGAQGVQQQLDGNGAAQDRQGALSGPLKAGFRRQANQKNEYGDQQKAAQPGDNIVKGFQNLQSKTSLQCRKRRDRVPL